MRPKLWLAVAVWMCCGCRERPDPLPGFPKLVLWAWERPERLEFVDSGSVAVAFLARTVTWNAGQIASRPRMQPLRVAEGTALMAVVRLESQAPPLPEAAQIGAEILKAASTPRVRALQVDFDARFSEREWYGRLLQDLHRNLNRSMPLSITALASWCDKDNWLDELPVAEAVPMLFRMGAGEPREARHFRALPCRASFGISTDELPADLPHGRRLFVFHPRAWDLDAYRGVVRLAAKWR